MFAVLSRNGQVQWAQQETTSPLQVLVLVHGSLFAVLPPLFP